MKRLICLFSLLFIGFGINAQDPGSRLLVEGLVMNHSYKVLKEARMVILSKKDTVTVLTPNSKGVFQHLFRADGKYQMIFQMEGYDDYTLSINTNGMGDEFDYDLTGMMIKLSKANDKKKKGPSKSEIFFEASFDSFVFKSEGS